MKILVVGGTGMIGTDVARLLREKGQDITIGARKPPTAGTPSADFPLLIDDYTRSTASAAELGQFDAVVFSAGNDVRHIGSGVDPEAFWRETQIEGVPNYIARLRDAGVKRVVHLGSYYHQAMPHLVDTDIYVRGRALADSEARALATPGFNVSTLNPPSIVGIVPGTPIARYQKLFAYARGELDVPPFAPLGGTNYMSVESLSDAVWGALQHAESGKAYLIGGENLSFRDYFQLFFDAVGNPHEVEARDEDHPLLPPAFMIHGRGGFLHYEPDPAETALLGYRRDDVRRAVDALAAVHA